MALFDIDKDSELSWMRNSEELELARDKREFEQLFADELDHYQPRIAVAKCDGTGIVEEYYFDVDQTEVVKCKGCCACDPERFPEVEMIPVMKQSFPRKPMKTAHVASPGIRNPKKGKVA